MDQPIHPAAVDHLPFFITPPGQPDILFNVMAVVIVVVILLIGSLYFTLHALPERMAHRATRTQLQIVAVLCLIALFTHNHLFWIAGLLLALVEFPDFTTPANSVATSLDRIANKYENQAASAPIVGLSEPAGARSPYQEPPVQDEKRIVTEVLDGGASA
ncbi:hypothetical protein [Mesorhizobium sp. 1B3]|uniref:hypothetical protein n=1 Tax=Mesorhizobium sp. 1B3 TaxID=3243599 RepID=UPI003D970C10